MIVRDPLRNVDVPLTPEERVRQWFIDVLLNQCGVPCTLMKSEVGFMLGEKQFRADILVWDRQTRPLAIVECKAPSVQIDNKVLEQAIRYNIVLSPRWIILTNGGSTVVLKKQGENFVVFDSLPSYEEMTN